MARTTQRYYDLNGLIRIMVEGPRRYLAYFDNEYERISQLGSAPAAPTVALKIVDRIDPAMRREIRYKDLFCFGFAVQDLGTPKPTILFERHWLDRAYVTPVAAFIQGQLLEPVAYLKLLENDVLFMHAAGVAKDGKAYVFPAHGGTGKTTLALSLMRHGFELMGDDLLMVDTRSGTVHPYARPLHLFTYNLKTLAVPPRIRAAIATKDVIRYLIAAFTGKKFLISTRAHAEEILEVKRSTAAQLTKAIFLKRDGSPTTLALNTDSGMEQAIDTIIESADLNESLASNIGVDPSMLALERAVIRKALQHLGNLQFVNTRSMRTEYDRIAFAEQYL